MNESILNSEGLGKALKNRRMVAQKHYFCNSQVVFDNSIAGRPKIIGHIFTVDQFKAFVSRCRAGESTKERLWTFFDKFGVPFGASGHKAIPADLTDAILDIAGGLK